MKTRFNILALFFVVLFLPAFGSAQGKNAGLLAEPYPGSIQETNPNITDASWKMIIDARSRTFYTKDPIEKVKDFYTRNLGELHDASSDRIGFARDIIAFKDVYDIVTKRGGTIGEGGESFYGGTMAGVTLFGKVTNNAYHYSVIKVYEKLLSAYLAQVQDPENFDPAALQKHMEDPELKKIQDRYERLKWSYFKLTNDKRKDAMPGNLSMDEVIFDKYYTAPEEARTKELERLQKKMSEASTAMKYDEASTLGDQMMKLMQNDPKKDWDTAIKCLEEMDKHSYATKIVIDTHPSKWDLTPSTK